MDLQSDNARRSCWWKTKHVCKISIEREEHSIVFDCKVSNFVIRLAGKPDLYDRNSVVPLLS